MIAANITRVSERAFLGIATHNLPIPTQFRSLS